MNKENENNPEIVPGSQAAEESARDTGSLQAHDTRREFVRKSLAAGIIAAQPSILSGLLRADGGSGGGQTTNNPWETTTGGETTYVTTYTTTVPQKPRFDTYKINIFASSTNGWVTNPANADVYTNTAPGTHPDVPAVPVSPPQPTVAGLNIPLHNRIMIQTNEAVIEIVQTDVVGAKLNVQHPHGGWARGYTIIVKYKHVYPSYP